MNKRGVVRSMFLAGEIVGAAIVAFLLISSAVKWSDSETPYKAYLARDMALVIDTLFSSPGNVIINYTQNVSNYYIDFNKNSTTVYKKTQIDGMSYKFVGYKGFEMDLTLENPAKIQFAKINDEIFIGESLKKNLNTLQCDETTGESLKDKKILVDPGYEKDNVNPSNEICGIANSFIFKVTNAWVNYFNIFSTRNIHEYDEDEGIISINCNDPSKTDESSEADVVISLRAGKDEDTTKNNIKAFIVSGSVKEKESRKLACLIINYILENKALDGIKITGASIVPVDVEATDKDFPEGIQDEIFVMLEIGNSESDNGKELLKKIPELGDSIYKGFMEYGK